MPRKPLDTPEGTNARGRGWGYAFHPQPLPHGECGVWGSAPEGVSLMLILLPGLRNMQNYPLILPTSLLFTCVNWVARYRRSGFNPTFFRITTAAVGMNPDLRIGAINREVISYSLLNSLFSVTYADRSAP